MNYDVEVKGAKKLPRNRQVHPYRAFVLTATETEDSGEEKQTMTEDCYVDCWATDYEDGNATDGEPTEGEKEPPRANSSPTSVNEDDCTENDEAYDSVEEFNRMCGNYENPFQHERSIRSRESSEEVSEDISEDERSKKKKKMSSKPPDIRLR